jgi:hypothetical protein
MSEARKSQAATTLGSHASTNSRSSLLAPAPTSRLSHLARLAAARPALRAGAAELLTAIARQLLHPLPLRVRLARLFVERLPIGSYPERLALDLVPRPHYGFCLYNAALLAAALGQKSISAIEFGVAGGNGLVNLEEHGDAIEQQTGVSCDIYGFDTGRGLPLPTESRDLPYIWKEGFYACDVERLLGRLRRAQLILGDVAETAPAFADRAPAPIGAVMIDLDLYSSTAAALKMFLDPVIPCLPRVFFYFDDITGGPKQAYNEFTGELLAIREFNEASATRKLAPLHIGRTRRFPADWNDRIYVLHNFDHRAYGAYVGPEDDQRPLLD